MTDRRPHCIVITGASAGIGQTLARTCVTPGVTFGLVACDAVRLGICAEQCRQIGATVITAQLNVRDAGAVAAWLTVFDDAHPLDLLIANAGAANTLSPASDQEDLARTHEVFDTNFYGALHTLLPVLARLRVRKRGHVAVISSLAAIRGMATSPAYYASKSAIKACGESVRPLLAADGMLLSLAFPGFVKTVMNDVFPGDKPFLWSANKAARHIRAKPDAGRAEIIFPTLPALGMRLLPPLPPRLRDRILDRLSYLPRAER